MTALSGASESSSESDAGVGRDTWWAGRDEALEGSAFCGFVGRESCRGRNANGVDIRFNQGHGVLVSVRLSKGLYPTGTQSRLQLWSF